MVFKGGHIPWNKGKTGVYSQETLKKLSDTHLGKHHTEEWKTKMSEIFKGKSNPFYGKHHTEKTLEKISKAKKGKYHTEISKNRMSEARKGKPTWNKGKHILEKTKKKLSEINKGKHLSEETKRKIKFFQNKPEQKEYLRQIRLTQIFPHKDTSIEVKIQQELSSRGIQFYKHFPVIGQPDIAFPDMKIAIFCDGDYWHNLEKQKEKDARITKQLRNAGWLVLRYWEHEINGNAEVVVDEIEKVLYDKFRGGKHDLGFNNRNEPDFAGFRKSGIANMEGPRSSPSLPQIEKPEANIIQSRNDL